MSSEPLLRQVEAGLPSTSAAGGWSSPAAPSARELRWGISACWVAYLFFASFVLVALPQHIDDSLENERATLAPFARGGDRPADATLLLIARACAGDLLLLAIEFVLTPMLFFLFAPVSLLVAAVATAARCGELLLMSANVFNYIFALRWWITPEVVPGLDYRLDAQFFVAAHACGLKVMEAPFGVHCLLLGYLIAASGYWGRSASLALGVLMCVAGVGYLLNGMIGALLLPQYGPALSSIGGILIAVGEAPFLNRP